MLSSKYQALICREMFRKHQELMDKRDQEMHSNIMKKEAEIDVPTRLPKP